MEQDLDFHILARLESKLMKLFRGLASVPVEQCSSTWLTRTPKGKKHICGEYRIEENIS
jgi:hypothetical protein